MVKVNLSSFNKQMDKAKKAVADLPEFAEDVMKAYTPRRSGNARSNTNLQGSSVVADYPYAQRLEDNHSPQTKGQGILGPTERAIQKEVDRRLKGI